MLTLEQAYKALKASEDKAREIGVTVTTAIVDDHGVLIALSKMDGALNISPDFSYAKAHTAQAIGLPSGDLSGYAAEGKPYFSLNTAFGGKYMLIAGGLPVKKDGKVIGAIGVGGSQDPNQDVQCAEAGLKILEG